MSRNSLGELELLVLLALARLGDGAYGAAIRKEINERAGRKVTPGAIYPTLDRLEERGLIRSYVGEPEAAPGGRAKRHFVMRPPGKLELRRTWSQFATLAEGLDLA